MNRHDLQKLAEAYTNVHEKKDSSYLETDMKKRQENNEKARKDMAKVKGQKNPHFEETNIRGNDSAKQKARLEKKRGMKLDDHPQFKKEEGYGAAPGSGEKHQERTKKWMDKKGMKGAPGLDAMAARKKEHEEKRGVKKEGVDSLTAAYNAVYEVEETETVAEDDKSYDRNRKRAAQRAADRNAARAAGKTGVVPGVGYVSPRKEKETYVDSAGTTRHKSGAKNEEVEQYVDFLIAEGYDCSELTWDDMSEEYSSLDEGLRSAVKKLFGKKEEPAKPESRGDQLRKKYDVGPEKSDTSAKMLILKKTRAKKEADQKQYGDSKYSKSVAKKSADAHDKYLKGGYSKYGADDARGSGNKARKRAAALTKEELEASGKFTAEEIEAIINVDIEEGSRGKAAIGGTVGNVAGKLIGSAVGGRTGAFVGQFAGGAAGAAAGAKKGRKGSAALGGGVGALGGAVGSGVGGAIASSYEMEGEMIEAAAVGAALGNIAGRTIGAKIGGAAGADIGKYVGAAGGAAALAKKGQKGKKAAGAALGSMIPGGGIGLGSAAGAALANSHEMEGNPIHEVFKDDIKQFAVNEIAGALSSLASQGAKAVKGLGAMGGATGTKIADTVVQGGKNAVAFAKKNPLGAGAIGAGAVGAGALVANSGKKK